MSVLSPTENKDHNLDLFDIFQRTQASKPAPLNDAIVIVDLRDLSSQQIASSVERLLGGSPKVIGLDFRFTGPGCSDALDTAGTRDLAELVKRNSNVILGYDLHATGVYDALRRELPGQLGYVNVHAADTLVTVRHFSARTQRGSTWHFSFAAQLAKAYDLNRWTTYKERDMGHELIHFLPVRDGAEAYRVVPYTQLATADSSTLKEQLMGKLVVVADKRALSGFRPALHTAQSDSVRAQLSRHAGL